MGCPTKHARDADPDPIDNIAKEEVDVKNVVVARYVSMIESEVSVMHVFDR